MMLLLRRASLLWLLSLASTVLSQDPDAPSAPSIPACAAECLKGGYSTGLCAESDTACTCNNQEFQANVTACVTVSCTVPESLIAKNASATSCGLPIRDYGKRYTVQSHILVALTTGFVTMRFAFKLSFAQLDIGTDDWIILACMIASAPSAVMIPLGTVKNGLGRDIWTLTPHEITKMLKYFYIMSLLYFAQVALLKLTLLFFYIRVFPSKGVRRLLWGTVIFVVLFGIAYTLVGVFQCRPIHHFWKQWDGLHEGTCVNGNAITMSNAAINIALDFWILGIPLSQLYGLQLHWKKKVGVGLMFSVGAFVTIVSILRLQALLHLAESDNPSLKFYDVSKWSSIEICVGMMCACLPTLRLLLVRLFPIIGGSSARTRPSNKYYNYGSGNELQRVGQSRQNSDVHVTVSSASHTGGPRLFEEDDGIMVKTSYTIERSRMETDEMSLVSHESGKAKPRS